MTNFSDVSQDTVQQFHKYACACPACMQASNTSSDEIVGSITDKPVFDNDQIVGQLNSGFTWSNTNLSYAFATQIPAGGFPSGESTGLSQFNGAQRTASRLAFSLWEDVANISFTETTNESSADILLVNYTGAGQAYAYFPTIGDVFINPQQSSNFELDAGGYGLLTLVHELGHSLGINHPGDYDAGRGNVLSYRDQAEYEQDSRQYTVMSYWDADNTGADHQFSYAATPLLHDILTVQAMYGANETTRTGDTVYGFNSTADRSVYDFSSSFYSGAAPILSIWDAGGTDTLDLSGYSTNSRIDLNDGAFSDVGGFTFNVSIAINAFIENAVGGSGNDEITGQELDNVLNGGAGDDTITGAAGNDTIIGGVGTDTARFDGVITNYTITDQGNDQYLISGSDGIDTLTGIEFVRFNNGETLAIGNAIGLADGSTTGVGVGDDDTDNDADDVPVTVTGDGADDITSASLTSLPATVQQSVGEVGDDEDFFRINPSTSGQLNLSLTGLSADIDLYLYSSSGRLLSRSIAGGSSDESINYSVTAGRDYYIRVTPFLSAESDYTLTASIAGSDSTSDPGDDTRATASTISVPGSVSQSVGFGADNADFYSFTASSSGTLTVNMTGLSDDIDVRLQNENGVTLTRSINGGASDESLAFFVTAGETYFINVYPFLDAASNYTLSTALSSSDTTGQEAGNSFDTAASLEWFDDTIQNVGGDDSVDYYTITSFQAGEMQVSLANLSGDVDIYLYDSGQNEIASSTHAGIISERINFDVADGETLFIKVESFDGQDTSYTLLASLGIADVPDLTSYTDGTFTLVEYLGAYTSGVVTYDESTGQVTISGADGQGSYATLDRIVFTDATLAVNREDIAFNINRLYDAALGRSADSAGQSFWIGEADGGKALITIANTFINSAEFVDTYGAELTSEEFVAAVYSNALGRTADADGLSYWAGQLNNGMTQAELIVNFISVQEAISRTEAQVTDGILF